MSPEDFLELLAEGKVILTRDAEDNYIYDASKVTTGVLPRDIIEQLEKARADAITQHETHMAAFDTFLAALKQAK